MISQKCSKKETLGATQTVTGHPDTVMLFEKKDTLKEITFLKMLCYTASMIFDAYDPTNSVAILHPREQTISGWTRVVRETIRYSKIYSLTSNVGHFRRFLDEIFYK